MSLADYDLEHSINYNNKVLQDNTLTYIIKDNYDNLEINEKVNKINNILSDLINTTVSKDDYRFILNKVVYQEIDLKCISYLEKLITRVGDFCVDGDELINFGAIKRHNNIKNILKNFKNGVDYCIINNENTKNNIKHKYILKPDTFKQCLMIGGNNNIYCKLYTFIEFDIYHYACYKKLKELKIMKIMELGLNDKDNNLDQQTNKLDQQTNNLDQQTNNLDQLQNNMNELKNNFDKIIGLNHEINNKLKITNNKLDNLDNLVIHL